MRRDRSATARVILPLRRSTSPYHREYAHRLHLTRRQTAPSLLMSGLHCSKIASSRLPSNIAGSPRGCAVWRFSAITLCARGPERSPKPTTRAATATLAKAQAYPTMREHSNESKTHRSHSDCRQRPGCRGGHLSAQLWSRKGEWRRRSITGYSQLPFVQLRGGNCDQLNACVDTSVGRLSLLNRTR